MTLELSAQGIWWMLYVVAIAFVILHSFLINKESPIAARILWILLTFVFGIFGAIGYYFFGSGEYYELKKV